MWPLSRKAFLQGATAMAATLASRGGLAAGAEAFNIKEIAPGVFVHRGQHALMNAENAGDIANASFVVGGDAVAVIDTGGSARVGAALRERVSAATDRPIRYVINTHMHPDHVFGNAAFEAGKPAFVAHHKMARGLAARADRYLAVNREAMGEAIFEGTRIVAPTVEVKDRLDIDLGGRSLVVEAQKTAHTDNDLVIHDPATGTLFLGDLLFAEHVPTFDGSIRGWLGVLDELSARPAQRVVPGHGPDKLPWPAALDPLRRYLTAVATAVRHAIKEGRPIDEAMKTAAQSEKDAWLLFKEYHARNVSAAFAELEWE